MKATIVIDHALPVTLRKTITAANALVIVGLTHRRTAGDDERLDFVHSIGLGLHFVTVTLDVFGSYRCQRHSQAKNDRRKQQSRDRSHLHVPPVKCLSASSGDYSSANAATHVRVSLIGAVSNLSWLNSPPRMPGYGTKRTPQSRR